MQKLKKLMLLVALLALTALVAVPAIAQSDDEDDVISQEIGQEVDESGDIAVAFDVVSEGNYASQCVAPLQFAQTGNDQNGQSFLQYSSESDDLEGSGNEFVFEPAIETVCDQAVQQSSAASSG